ncbi:hypothetical protein Tco_1175952 [Tanacetum coccineum]
MGADVILLRIINFSKSQRNLSKPGTPVDATLYRGMIGSLMYLTSSRPDLIYAVCLCARYQANPTEKHLNAVKRIFQYLKGTINMGLWYSKDTGMSLTAYSNADHAGCQDTRRSTSGSAQFLGDKLVSWSSKKQKNIAISSIEAEYIALSCVIALCCNNVQHSRAKHVDVRYLFINEQVENRIVELYFVRTEYQLADIFTKPLPRERFNFLIEKLDELYWTILRRNMNPVVTQQVALDNALVAHEKRLRLKDVTQELRTWLFWECISGKTTGLDRLRESRAQILWGMYNLKNVDYVALLWEDFMYQADNRDISPTRKEHMPYPRFTKVIINHFISKDKTISMRNKINLHTVCDDFLLGTLKFVSKTKDYQKKVAPKKARKFKKIASPSNKLSPVLEEEPVKKPKKAKKHTKKSTTVPIAGVVIRDTPGVSVSKKKTPAKGDKGKGMELLSDAALLEAAQVKEAL